MRFKGDSITGAAGSSVDAWPESSGSGMSDAVQTADPFERPTVSATTLNGHKVVSFDGSNDGLEIATKAGFTRNTGGVTIFAVTRMNNPPNTESTIVHFANGSGNTELSRVSHSVINAQRNFRIAGRRLDADSSQTVLSSTGRSDATWYASTGVWDYTNSDAFVYVNGLLDVSSTSFQTAGTSSDTEAGFASIGYHGTGVRPWKGDIAEIIGYNRVLTQFERAQVHAYIKDEYGLSVNVVAMAPSSIASGEAFGTPTLSTTLTSSPTAIGSAEAFGTPEIPAGAVTLSPAGIGSGEALGEPAVSAVLATAPEGIGTAGALGDPSLTLTLTASPEGIASATALGTPSLAPVLATAPGGIASAEEFGGPAISATLTVEPSGIGSQEALGSPAAGGLLTAEPSGITSAEALGAPTVGGLLAAQPAGIASAEAFGQPTITIAALLSPADIDSAEAFGTPAVSTVLAISAQPIGSANAFGSPVLHHIATPASITSRETFGTPTVSTILVMRAADTLPQAAFGTPTLTRVWVLAPAGIASPAAFGTATLTLQLTASPSGIPSPSAMGRPKLGGALILHFDNVLVGTIAPRRKGGKLEAPLSGADTGAPHWRGHLG
jgi:uncharacterized Zn-binding protein involved in type VI secretion